MFEFRPELRVEIRKLGTKFFAITTQDTGLEVCTNEFQHDAASLAHQGPLWLRERGVAVPDDAQPRFPGTANEGHIARVGQQLYGYLFGKARDFQKFLTANPDYRQARLTLVLHPDTMSLLKLPWEYLHDGEQFLCLNGSMAINRAPAATYELTPLPTPLPVRVLLVIAAPVDRETLDVERELSVMQDALENIVRTGALTMEVLEEPTLPALQDALNHKVYDVLHYIGHGAYSQNQQRGFLCFENPVGETNPLGAMHLKPLLDAAPDLRLVVLSACQSVPIGVADAFDNVATGLLQAGAPAVLTIPTSLTDDSTIEFAQVFYSRLTKGQLPIESLYHARLALKQMDDTRPPDRRRFDWGVPALYLRAQKMVLIDQDMAAETPPLGRQRDRSTAELSLPALFVDRVEELHTLRRALQENVGALYLWGSDGVGKSSLAAKFIEYSGVSLNAVLVINCWDLVEPVAALEKIARFWRSHGTDKHQSAASMLLDMQRDPTERARTAQQMITAHRHLIIFDDFDVWLTSPSQRDAASPKPVASETIRAILCGLLSVRAATTYLFIGQRRWSEFDGLLVEEKREINLPPLSQRQAILLMNALSHLMHTPPATKMDLFKLVGGHPETLRLLNGWLAGGRVLSSLLVNPPVEEHKTEAWQHFFLDEILAGFAPSEREALTLLTILKGPFNADIASKVTKIALKYIAPLLEWWKKVSLLQFHHAEENDSIDNQSWYTIHSVVRDYTWEQLDHDAYIRLHAQVAAYYGAPFLDEARRRMVARNIMNWSEERLGWLARDGNGILGMWVRQTQNIESARQSLKRALAWQYHLYQAGEQEAAAQIVRAIVPVLNRWEQFDLSETLLRRNAATATGTARMPSLDELAQLYLEQGHLREALSVYQEVYRMLAAQGARDQMAHVLRRIARAYYQIGDYDNAIKQYEAALRMMRDIEDADGQALCLHQLTSIYRQIGDLKIALVYSQAVKELDNNRSDVAGTADAEYEQGLILKHMGRLDNALECFKRSLEMACNLGDQSKVVNNLREISALSQQSGQLDAAIDALLKVLEMCQRFDAHEAVMILESLKALYEQQGSKGQNPLNLELAERITRLPDNRSDE